jgi:hypothetical protein
MEANVLMVRFWDRSIALGIGGVALVIAASSMVLKRNEPHSGEASWSSHQRGLVVTGTVRAKTSETTLPSSAPAQTAADGPPVQKHMIRSDDKQSPASDLNISPQSTGSSRPVEHRPRAATSRKYVANEHASQIAPRTRSMKHSEIDASDRRTKEVDVPHRQDGGARQLAPVVDADPLTRTPDSPPLRTGVRDTLTAHLEKTPITSPASPPAPGVAESAPASKPTTAGGSPLPIASSGPKTRKQVEDELRKARQDGSLPRFGNPDPAGPGGTPNAPPDQ